MRDARIKIKKKRAFSMIDIIFAVLFVFIMLILGLKFIYTSKEIDTKSSSTDLATIIIANEIESYHNHPQALRNGEFEFYYDKMGVKLKNAGNDAHYTLCLKSEIIKENLDSLALSVYELESEDKILQFDTKVYIPTYNR